MTERPVSRAPTEPGARAFPRSAGGRALLSALFVLHWGAVAVFVVLDTASQRLLAASLQPLFREALAPAAQVAWPVARVWLDATATRQHWMLFAPAPSDWAVSTIAVVSSGAARPDTLLVPGPVEDPFPHWTRPRSYDLAFDLAYEGTGLFYRTLEARRLCRGLEREPGGPKRLTLGVLWQPLDAPWAAVRRTPRYQEVGTFECERLLASPPPGRQP